MELTSRRRALQAAAKVAFSCAFVSAGACGGSTLSSDSGETSAGAEPSATNPAAESGVSEDPLRKNRDAGGTSRDAARDTARDTVHDGAQCFIAHDDAGLATRETRACCASQLSTVGTADGGWGALRYDGNPADVRPCCEAIVANYWAAQDPQNHDEAAAFQACCNTFDAVDPVTGQATLFMTCTPWGPPMPPRMLRASLGVA